MFVGSLIAAYKLGGGSDNWDLGILASLSLVWSSQIGFKGSGNKELQNGKVCKTNIKKYAQKIK